MLDQITKGDVEKFREGAKFFKESSELFDRMGDLIEDENRSDEEKQEEIEIIMGKIIMSYLKAQTLFS